MPRQKKLRTGLLAALSVAMLSSGGLVAVGLGAGAGADPPDLVPYLPTTDGTPHSRFMDTVQEPGHTLLRFDTVLKNVGSGRLDLYRAGCGPFNVPDASCTPTAEQAATYQKIWQTGEPLDDPTVGQPPPPGDIVPLDPTPPPPSSVDSPSGHDFFFFDKPGHVHFHLPHAAQYQLVTTGDHRMIADSPKNSVGFCLFDSYGRGDFATDPCHYGQSDYKGLIREGISPGLGDLYGAGLTDQWVDVTDVMPGQYEIKAVADPDNVIHESNYDNNTDYFPITVAGAAPAPQTASTGVGAPVDVSLSATVYSSYTDPRTGQQVPIPNRIVPADDPSCGDNGTANLYDDTNCFASNTNPGIATFTVTGASGGTAAVVNPSGTTATLRFTPAPGFSGTATVTYTATDSRGLTSPAATATIQVGSGSVSSAPPGTASGGKSPGTGSGPGAGSAHFTLSAGQLLINQRIGQAAIRRLNAVAAKLDGRPAPAPPKAHKHGTVTLSAAQLLINQRIYQAAIRRAAALEARLDHTPPPTAGSGKGGTVHLTLGQLIINQRIAQAAVRRANALVARVG